MAKNVVGSRHKPVLLQESVDALSITEGSIIVDATLGGGGHAQSILNDLNGKGTLIAFDVDNDAIARFSGVLEKQGFKSSEITGNSHIFQQEDLQVILVEENFKELSATLKTLKIKQVHGVLADLGISTDQLFEEQRGISFQKDEYLDMRLDKRLKISAADLVNGLYKKELVRLFKLSDEQFASHIANAITRERKDRRIETTRQLASLIERVVRKYQPKSRLHPATRVFQALRIAVNQEIDSLHSLLPQALEALNAGKRLSIISFHSGEDRLIKNFFKEQVKLKKANIITRKPIRPTEDEIARNQSSSSAKLRVIEKI